MIGEADQEVLYRDDEPRLSVEEAGQAWSMEADGQLFRLMSEGEAERILLAYLLHPFFAVQTSILDPLPRRMEAVCVKMLSLPFAISSCWPWNSPCR